MARTIEEKRAYQREYQRRKRAEHAASIKRLLGDMQRVSEAIKRGVNAKQSITKFMPRTGRTLSGRLIWTPPEFDAIAEKPSKVTTSRDLLPNFGKIVQ